MYNRREKLQLFNQLRGEEHAKADLSLLEEENPRHPKLTRFARDPQRYADEILYALLDICDAGEIEDNREFIKGMEEASSETLTKEQEEEKSSEETPSDSPGTEETPDTPEGKAPPEETAGAAGQEEDGKKK